MRSSFLVSAVAGAVSLWGCATVLANPIAIDTSRRTATMIAEDVRVMVGTGESKVSGVYKFRLDDTPWETSANARVRIYLPVPLARGGSASDDSATAQDRPIVRLGRRQFTSVEKETLGYGDKMESVKLPKGWLMRFYLFEIPVRYFVAREFEITVDYVQPHFPGDIVGYVPLNPPRDPGAARIRFEAAKGRALKPAGLRLFSKPMDSLEVQPLNRKLIQVRSVSKRE
jgi:hypothetical protein